MPAMVESIAGMTRSRDRDGLDAALAFVLATRLGAEEVSLVTLYGETPDLRARVSLQWRVGDRLPPEARPEGDEEPLALDAFPAGRAALAAADGWACLHPAGSTHRCCAVTIRIDAEAVGWAQVVLACSGQAERRQLLALVAIYANHLAVIDAGERDTLTGLLNRRSFDAVFGRRLDALALEAKRPSGERREGVSSSERAPRWLAVIDIDHFKRINDRFGHLYGDEVLVMIAQRMRHELRITDQVFRFGGEEFVVLLAPTPVARVHEVLDRLRERVAAQRFPQIGQVTVSIGYTRVGVADSSSDAFGRADDALYRAKDAGRNRTIGSEIDGASPPEVARVLHSDVDLF